MVHNRKVSVALTGEQIADLKEAVETGEYPSISEIVRQAIWDWRLKRKLRQEDIERLRQLWDEGQASGPARPLDMEKLLRKARKRLARVKAAHDDQM
jgi:antitoxin ParD1/3/4